MSINKQYLKKVTSPNRFQTGISNFNTSNKSANNESRNWVQNNRKFSREEKTIQTVPTTDVFASRCENRNDDRYRKISKSPVGLFNKKYMTKQIFTQLTSDELGTKFTIIK